MNRPSLASINAWTAHERRCLDVLCAALSSFPIADLDESEESLNRRLYQHITQTAREIERRDGVTLPVVVPEGRNPPLVSDQERAAREDKRPDFYWGYHDPDGEEPARQFVLECKRLTLASSSWVYAEQYVIAGVKRFTSPQHGYGEQAWTAAMVGYLQRSDPATALADVNNYLSAAGLPTLTPSAGTDTPSTIRHQHQLIRTIYPSPFGLVHLWRHPSS